MSMEKMLIEMGLTAVRQRGDEIWASCPAHHDSGDSWSVNVISGMHNCYACNYRGHIDTLVSDLMGLPPRQAMRYVKSFGVEMAFEAMQAEFEAMQAEVARPVPSVDFVPEIRIARFSTEIPAEQLERRHITAEAALLWKLRYDDGVGWIIPIYNAAGELLGWQEKRPDKRVINRPPKMKVSLTVFGAERLKSSPRIVVVESPLDAVYLDTLGIPAAATFGASVSDAQIRLVSQYADEVIMALDNDAAGREHTYRILTTWAPRIRCSAVEYWVGAPKDVGEMPPEEAARVLEPVNALDWLGAHSDFQRQVVPLSRGGRRKNGHTKEAPRGLQHGSRKDHSDHRRR